MIKIIGKHRVKNLVDRGAYLVDMRSPVAYRDGHITGSVNLPYRNFLNTISGMPRKSNIVIFGESSSHIDVISGHNYANQLGFTNVYVTEYETLKD